MAIDPRELAQLYPVLFHMASAGSWPSIRRHGLLSTTALLDRFEIVGTDRYRIESCHRPECVEISHTDYGVAVVRDQKPMSEKALQNALKDDLMPSDWFRILNAKAFFWVRRERLLTMMNARAYRNQPKTVLEVDSQELLRRYGTQVRLATINTGATFRYPAARGLTTFLPLDEYPKSKRRAVVELAVEGAVPDISELVIRVSEVLPGGGEEVLWERG